MPNISTQVPVVQMPSPTEMSSLHSKRDSNGIFMIWKKLREIIHTVNKLIQLFQQNSRNIKELQQQNYSSLNLTPFQIYRISDSLRGYQNSQISASTNWHTVRVRGGLVLTANVSTGSFVTGTDMMQNFAYNDYLPSASYGPYDIIVPTLTPQYWFWIESQSTSSYTLRYAQDPTIVSAGNPNTWVGFPSASSNYIPIGWVDTYTSASIRRAYVRQLQVGDVVSSGGGSGIVGEVYKGRYDPSASYSLQNEVRVLPGYDYGTKNITIGCWVCVYPVPLYPSGSTGSRQAGVDYFPKWPEPCHLPFSGTGSLSASAAGRYWELKSLLPQLVTSCAGGTFTQYWADLQPTTGHYIQSSSNYIQCSGSL